VSGYAELTREQIEQRLRLAEDVCALYSWSPTHNETDRDKATYELWLRWITVASTDRRDYPHLNDDVIAELARRRDETRAATLRRMGVSEVPS
jgi:hypothetical protein